MKYPISFILLTIFCISTTEYKNIIFDFGGVILSNGPRYFIEQTGQYELKGITSSPAWQDWDKGLISKEQLIKKLSEKYNKQSIHELMEYTLSNRPFIQETVAIIKQLKAHSYRIYLLSNFSQEAYDTFIKNDSLFELFDGVLCSHQVKCIKPDHAIYRSLLEQYQLQPSESIFIDDTIRNVHAAQELGITAVLYQPDSLAHSLQQYALRGLNI